MTRSPFSPSSFRWTGAQGVGTATLTRPETLTPLARDASAQPPKGFTSLFNGKDLSGWRGRQPNYNPAVETELPKD